MKKIILFMLMVLVISLSANMYKAQTTVDGTTTDAYAEIAGLKIAAYPKTTISVFNVGVAGMTVKITGYTTPEAYSDGKGYDLDLSGDTEQLLAAGDELIYTNTYDSWFIMVISVKSTLAGTPTDFYVYSGSKGE